MQRRACGIAKADAHRVDARERAVCGPDGERFVADARSGHRLRGGKPKLANQRVILDSHDLPFRCTLETQNLVPPHEKSLTFSAYGYQGTDVCVVDLQTKKVTNLTNSPGEYDEPEGIFHDGKLTLVECDKQNKKGSSYVDIWKLRMDGGGYAERLTFFSDFPGYKSSNPVVSDDGRFMAFQMAKSKDPAGVGYGIFIYDFEKARQSK